MFLKSVLTAKPNMHELYNRGHEKEIRINRVSQRLREFLPDETEQ